MARTISVVLLGVDRVSRTMRAAAREAGNAADETGKLSKAMSVMDKVGKASGLATATAGVTALGAAAAPAVAAIAALPAAMAASKIATGTLKVGLVGVGEAMSAVAEDDAEALNESLKKLSPNAAAFVRQAAAMRTQVKGLQGAVQERLFAGLDRDLKSLGSTYLPIARKGMVDVAGALNGIGREAARTASTPWFQGQVGKVFAGTTGIVRTLQGAVQPLLESVLRLAVAGMPLVQRMAAWAVQGGRVAAAWLQAKVESGALARTLTGIGNVLAQLGTIGGNVARTIGNMAGQTGQFNTSGGNLLVTLGQLTARMSAWSASAEGQSAAAALFRTLGTAASQLAVVLPLLLSPLGWIVKAIAAMPPGLQGVVGKMLGWSIVVGVIMTRLKILTAITIAHTAAVRASAAAMATWRGLMSAQALGGFIAGLRNVNLAMAANATLSTRVGAALRSQVMLWRQMAAAQGVSTARIIAHSVAQKAAAIGTKIWAAAQWLLNAAMTANPIGLIVLAVVALIGVVVLAYKRFDWFRNLVNAAWSGIKSAVMSAWAFIKPVFMQIAHVLVNVIGTALRWYWAYVKFVFTTVWTVIKTVWGFLQPIFQAIANVVRSVLGVAFVWFQNIFKVVWIAIQIYIKVAWAIIKGYFNLIKWYVTNVLAPIFRWLYNSVIKPVWSGIQLAIKVAWAIIKGYFNAIKLVIQNVLAPIFRWLWNTIIKPVWNGIKATISSVINNGIKPAFNGLKTAVNAVKNAFQAAVNGIKSIWDKLKGIAKTPVNFVIGLYNNGIVKLVNGIAGLAGIKTRLSKIPTFATGGVLPGYAPGVDSLIAAVSPGEAIMRPEFTRAAGASWVQTANTIARRGGVEGVRRWMDGGAYANGGIVPGTGYAGEFALGGIVGGFLGKVKDFTLGNVGKAARGILDRVLGAAVPGEGMFRDVIAAIPRWVKDNILGFVKELIGKVGGDGKKVVAVAEKYVGLSGNPNKFTQRMGMNGLPWCGMFVDGVFDEANSKKALNGVSNPASVWSYRALQSVSRANARPGDLGLYRGDAGHINIYTGKGAITIGGNESNSVRRQSGYINSASSIRRPKFARGGIVPRLLAQDRNENSPVTTPLATQAFRAITGQKVYDNGGMLQPGWTLAHNATGRPEPVLTGSQWDAMTAEPAQELHVHVNHVPGYSTPQDVTRAVRQAELAARSHRRR